MWLQALASELAITLADGSVWVSIGQGLLFGAVCLLFGIWVARFVGLLTADAPAGETLGVGLGSGLLVLAAWWAAIGSGARSSFTPVAVGFAIAIGLAVVRRWGRSHGVVGTGNLTPVSDHEPSDRSAAPSARRRDHVAAGIGGAAFVIAVALLYGSTLAHSASNGVQPLDFSDEAYYSVLGRDLAKTGTETIYSPSGFDQIDGLPTQTWYHWGELWLAAAAISIFGMAPLDARHFVVLPILLLAAAALTGTVVRRMTGSTSRGAFLFGALACLFLAPMRLVPGPTFSTWAVGLTYTITLYGIAAVAVILALYCLTVLDQRNATLPLTTFVASTVTFILPAHIVVALLAIVGVASVSAMRTWRSFRVTRHLPLVTPAWRRTFAITIVGLSATLSWGLVTGHGAVSSELAAGVTPFNATWRESLAVITVGAGAFLAIAVAWFIVRKQEPIEADLYLGTSAIVVIGAVIWGAVLANFYTFYVFFAALAIFATPAGAVAVWRLWVRVRATSHRRLRFAVIVLCAIQLDLGVAVSIGRLQAFGPGGNPPPVSVAMLAAIMQLPRNAKLAYACQPFEETAFWDGRLLGLDARTGRRVVPMCFQAEIFGPIAGGPVSADVPSRSFLWAPQHAMYPHLGALPSPGDVASFMRANGIEYIYADALHPNSLVPDAIPVASSGVTQLLRLP